MIIVSRASSVCITIIAFTLLHLAVSQTDQSTCPNNKNSACTVLPFNISNPPDVWLNVPNLSVDEISIVVENLQAHVSISASVLNLVSLNAGVDVSIDKVNLTITGVEAQVQLAVYLDNVAALVTRTMQSLDLNPLLASVVTGVLDTVNNLLATFTKNGQLINQIINGAGQIVNQVLGTAGQILSSEVVGDYTQNMTFTGVSQLTSDGNMIKQYSYSPSGASSQTGNVLVNLVFDTIGNVVSASVVNPPSTTVATTAPTTVSTVSTTVAG